MKKLFNSIKLFFVFSVLMVLASCNNLTQPKKPASDGKAYLKFSVNADRSVFNPQSLSYDDIGAVRLYIKKNGTDINNLNNDIEYVKTFFGNGSKNAVQVFEEAQIELPANCGFEEYYHFIIELCIDQLSTPQSELAGRNYRPDQLNDIPKIPEGEKYYMPLQTGKLEKVLIVPGLNTLSFTTQRYRKGNWKDFYSLLKVDYTAKASEVGYMEAELRTWPYDNEKWIPEWDCIFREENWDNGDRIIIKSGAADANGNINLERTVYVQDGYYKLNFSLYDKAEAPRTLIKTFSDVIYLSGYKTIASKEIKLSELTAAKLDYGVISIDEPWDLCVNKGTVTVTDTTPVEDNKQYEVALNYNGEELLATTLTKADMKLSWSTNIFEGKTSVGGVFVCQVVVDGQEFDLLVPDRTYLSYSIDSGETDYLDPAAPTAVASLTGDYFIRLSGTGTEQSQHEEQKLDDQGTPMTDNDGNPEMNLIRDFATIYDYTSILPKNMNSGAKVFLDMSAVTGINKIFREDIQLAESGAWLTGIAFPESVERLEDGVVVCPIKQVDAADDRYYELSIIFGSQAYRDGNGNYTFRGLVDSGNKWLYWDDDDGDPSNDNQNKRNLYNPVKKFIVSKDNPYLVTFQDGALLGWTDGDTVIIGSADVIEALSVPYSIRKIESHAFAGNRKLETVSDWGNVEEICSHAFDASALEGDLELGDRVFELSDWCFGHTKLTSLSLSDSVKLIFPNVIPQDAYLGYKPGSKTRTDWEWISKDTFDNDPNYVDKDLYSRYFNLIDEAHPQREPLVGDGVFTLRDWKNEKTYKYKDYLGFTDFYDHYCWRIDE